MKDDRKFGSNVPLHGDPEHPLRYVGKERSISAATAWRFSGSGCWVPKVSEELHNSPGGALVGALGMISSSSTTKQRRQQRTHKLVDGILALCLGVELKGSSAGAALRGIPFQIKILGMLREEGWNRRDLRVRTS